MTGGPGGVPALPCAICGCSMRLPWPCLHVHEDHCHDCYRLSLAGNPIDGRAHRPPSTPTLTLREQQALASYARHLVATVGAAPLADLLTGENEA